MFVIRWAALALLPTLISGCGDSASAQGDIPASRVNQAVGQLDAVVADVMQRSGVPGMAVAVVHGDTVLYSRGFGVKRLGEPAPVQPETVFQLASVSKPIGATVVTAQIEKGVVSWQTPVQQHLPWFELNDPATSAAVTIGDMYAHRSGLPDHAGDELEEIGHDRRSALQRLRHLPLEPLRSTHAYTNLGLTAGAEAVAEASGASWEDLSEAVLYRPLGMSATSSRFADFMARADRAHPHVLQNGAFEPATRQRQPDAQSPAGGVSSNVVDMARWMALVLNDGRHNGAQLLSRTALAHALSPQAVSSPATDEHPAGHYGYGFNISTTHAGGTRYSHSGAFTLGAATNFALLPAARTGIIVLTNAQPVGAAEAITSTYLDLVEFGRPTRDWFDTYAPAFAAMNAPTGRAVGLPYPDAPEPARPLHAYAGSFQSDYLGDARIEPSGSDLVLTIGPAGNTHVLHHWNGDTFVFELGGEVAPPGSRSAVDFTIGPGGIATGMTIELYDEYGQGTLTRR